MLYLAAIFIGFPVLVVFFLLEFIVNASIENSKKD